MPRNEFYFESKFDFIYKNDEPKGPRSIRGALTELPRPQWQTDGTNVRRTKVHTFCLIPLWYLRRLCKLKTRKMGDPQPFAYEFMRLFP